VRVNLAGLVTKATRELSDSRRAHITTEAAAIRDQLWDSLIEKGSDLASSCSGVLTYLEIRDLRDVFAGLGQAIRKCLGALLTFKSRIQQSHVTREDMLPKKQLRLAVGGPGILGCANMAGTAVDWRPMLDRNVGVVEAVRRLELDIIGMPAARLRDGCQAPPGIELTLECRGGPSYASVAWAWRHEIREHIVIRRDIGNEVRPWIDFTDDTSGTWHLCTCYFPTAGAGNDLGWCAELSGLEEDLASLTSAGPGDLERTIIMGDFNFQPTELT
jgi:hypothetical protein